MIIKRIAVGNSNESFVEKSIIKGLNIISSDDNNRGKTIIIQSLIYCLGNVPVFPAGFDYKKYYYIVEFEYEDRNIIISRYTDNFVIREDDSLMFFGGVSEMKRYWSKNIFEYPNITKNGIYRTVDPELFVQLFFVGQDKKDTDNISNKGFYNKVDFYNMLFDYANLGAKGISIAEINLSRKKVKKLKTERDVLLKKHKILKSKDVSTNYISQYSDKVALEEKLKNIDKIKGIISDLRISRNKTLNKKIKYEITLKELNSLNRTVAVGELKCMDCDSNHISYSTSPNSEAYTFDVSTIDVRKEIIDSIKEKIFTNEEDVERLTAEINLHQKRLQEWLTDDEISIESIIVHKKDIMDAAGIERELIRIDEEISILNDSIKMSNDNSENRIKQQNKLLAEIISEMNSAYKMIDPNGTLDFDGLFTKRDETYSGSESTEFHLVKLYAFAKVLQHEFPIIVDSFRAEDLSTDREKVVINLFKEISNQVIFTTTLKTEEIGKYDNIKYINHIDYSNHVPSKILDSKNMKEFKEFCAILSIKI